MPDFMQEYRIGVYMIFSVETAAVSTRLKSQVLAAEMINLRAPSLTGTKTVSSVRGEMLQIGENMYILISVTRDELTINESFYKTKAEAIDGMIADIICMTDYNSVDEIVMAADSGTAGFSDDEAWAETKQYGEGQWKIVQVPHRDTMDNRSK